MSDSKDWQPLVSPGLEVSHTLGEAREDGASGSDSEYQKALEVIFDAGNAHRRRSSLISDDSAPLSIRRPGHKRNNTACFVHGLLEQQHLEARQDGGSDIQVEKLNEEHRATHALDKSWGTAIDTHRESKVTDNDASETPVTHSRLLTKKELSDMAWSVRELSKKLGRLKLKINVKTIFILTKAYDQTLIEKTKEVVAWLLSEEREQKYIVYVEDTLKQDEKFDAKSLVDGQPGAEKRLKYWNNELAARTPHTFDFVISLGGDGTVLYASWLFQRVVPPVLSFSLGSLGFLTKFDFDTYQNSLNQAFRDGVTVSLRLRFECTIMRSQTRKGNGGAEKQRDLVEELIGEESADDRTHKPDGTFMILNDLVVDRGPNPTMSAIDIFGDENHFTTVQADGICVATPTGSTAYNLAAGGSLCHPENPVILVTAICAHTLSFRPIILPDTIVLRIGVNYDARTSSWASFDGRERMELNPGDYVTISASRYPFANVMPPGRSREEWIQSISTTLNWNSRQKQKAFDVKGAEGEN